MRPFRISLLAAIALSALGAAPPSPSVPVGPVRLSFVPNAALFSLSTRQETLVDPEVFVAAPGESAALGFEQIAHLPGIRNAEMRDDPTGAALDANGRSLGFDLQHWFAANGVVQLDVPGGPHGTQTVIVRFANLIARGRYSLFVGRPDTRTPGYAPLDANGKSNSFLAASDGTGGTSVVVPQTVPHGGELVVVYHADHKDHGVLPGMLGIDAFRQLAVRVP